MSAIRGKDTKPEMVVRRMLHALGYRYRLHDRSLPGSPDLVFRSRGKVIFVHGCFWHRHNCKLGRPKPKTHSNFWENKLAANKARDLKHRRQLRTAGWTVFIVWECQTSYKKLDSLAHRLIGFLES